MSCSFRYELASAARNKIVSQASLVGLIHCAWIRAFNKIEKDGESLKALVSGWRRWNLYTDGAGVARFGIGQNNLDYTASKIIFR